MGNPAIHKIRWQILSCLLAAGIAATALPAARSKQVVQTTTTPAPAPAPIVAASAASEDHPATQGPAAARDFFHVKYISDGSVYLDAGRDAGLEEGMVLHLVHADPGGGTTDSVRFQGKEPIADVRIFSVADSSSAAEIIQSREDLKVGDIAYLDVKSVRTREDKTNELESENYPVVMTFSYGDPLDEEVRASATAVKAPPIGNQVRGLFGFDTGMLSEPGGFSSRRVGLMIQADVSRIAATHWNLTGYWRGDLNTQSTGNVGGIAPSTLNDMINRTYHLGLYYVNPDSVITMGVGRLFLPYAPSLSTIDGGYFGYKINQHMTAGLFAGSTPDPTSWSYN
ncbi:MAG: hypothetical protein ACRD4Y_16715, partial [Candidatus Acidiferrales bacterium]